VSDERELLRRTAEIAADFLETLDERSIWPPASVDELRSTLGGPLPDSPSDPLEVVETLAAAAEPGIVGIPSGRYFGFVIGGSLPAALAADWLASTWDQNAGLVVCGPSAAVVEEIAGDWLKGLFGIPSRASFALVTGCQMAHTTCLAAARHGVLAQADWDVERDGLFGAPRVRILAGAKRHVTLDRSLRLLGFGAGSTVEIGADGQGRMLVDELAAALREGGGPTIVCAKAGEVNTGSFDDLEAIADLVEGTGAWLHVDGAIGLWAATSPRLRGLVTGVERADSWATDAHKWLNVPYDCGIAFVAHPESHRAAMAVRAAYLVQDAQARDEMDWTPEFSRRARAFTVYAALRSLGRQGVAELVESSCDRAKQFADAVAQIPGCVVLNEVVLNQVLFRFGNDETTKAVLATVQASGEAWMGGTTWNGRPAIRLSVSNWRTSERDIERTLAAFERTLVAVAG
jgi:glutamate/tyrosine decarboxylase-like PLP-dependent enzyme